MAHVQTNQPLYLGCVFAVVRDWIAKGRKRTEEMRHSFVEWAQVLDWIVQNIFNEQPLMDDHEAAQERASNPYLTFLRVITLAVLKQNKLGEEVTTAELYEIAVAEEVAVPGLDGWPDDDLKGMQQIGSDLKHAFQGKDLVRVDDFIVTRSEREVERKDGKGKVPKKFYVFQKASLFDDKGSGETQDREVEADAPF